MAVLGHNGSGKSTFAKHINALLQPTGGTLWVKGMNTQEEGLIWEIRQTAGMVFQNPDNQLVATVVEEDIAFGPENMGVPPKEIRMRVDEALDAVRMKEFAAYTPSKLSGGQKQRIAIEGITVILITHYMDEAVRGDKVYVIDDGDLVMKGTPREIFVQVEKLKEYGLDVPQVTEVTYLLRKEGIDLPADILTVEEMVGALCQFN